MTLSRTLTALSGTHPSRLIDDVLRLPLANARIQELRDIARSPRGASTRRVETLWIARAFDEDPTQREQGPLVVEAGVTSRETSRIRGTGEGD